MTIPFFRGTVEAYGSKKETQEAAPFARRKHMERLFFHPEQQEVKRI